MKHISAGVADGGRGDRIRYDSHTDQYWCSNQDRVCLCVTVAYMYVCYKAGSIAQGLIKELGNTEIIIKDSKAETKYQRNNRIVPNSELLLENMS